MLAGCTAAPVPAPKPTPDAVSAPEALEMTVGEVGRGTFVSADSTKTTGSIVFGWDEGFYAKLIDYQTSSTEQMTLVFTDERMSAGSCLTDTYYFAADPTNPWPEGRISLPDVDPGYLDSAAIGYYPTLYPAKGECAEPGAAYADIEWTLADLRPDLVVKDSGATNGARGELTLTASGYPLGYTTADGDVLPEIAGRFGIEVADIAYLNPNRLERYEPTMAYAGEILNLSKADRGARARP